MTRCSGNVQPLSHKLSQKFYDHSSTGCRRKSAITQSKDVAEILKTLIKG